MWRATCWKGLHIERSTLAEPTGTSRLIHIYHSTKPMQNRFQRLPSSIFISLPSTKRSLAARTPSWIHSKVVSNRDFAQAYFNGNPPKKTRLVKARPGHRSSEKTTKNGTRGKKHHRAREGSLTMLQTFTLGCIGVPLLVALMVYDIRHTLSMDDRSEWIVDTEMSEEDG